MSLMILLVLVMWGLPGVAGALMSRPFEPQPSLAPLRYLVAGFAVAAGGTLIFSLGQQWWVVEDWEREATLVTRANSPLVLVIAATILASGLATVTGAWGHRNWALAALNIAWPLVGFAWLASTGEFVDSDASGSARFGLHLATWAIALTTVAALLASFGRLAERGRRTAQGVAGGGSWPD